MIESIQLDLATQNDAQELLNIYAYCETNGDYL